MNQAKQSKPNACDDKANPLDFYDVVINIESLLELKNGYEIEYTEPGRNKYNMKKNDKCCTVGVVGNRNKGKTYILEKLSGLSLPSGYTVTTKGISVVYPKTEEKQAGIVLIDTAGLETPLLRNNSSIDDMNLIARDKQLTELFLQKFIIEKANVLIAVVGTLTLSDQKLLHRIIDEWKASRSSKLFVVHNLVNYETIAQINEYIETILMDSFTFTLEATETFVLPSLLNPNNSQPKTNEIHTIYQEKVIKKNEELTIIHLIMARENSEAGNKLNINTLNYLQNQILANTNNSKFAVIEEIQKYLAVMSNELFEEPKVTEKDLEIVDEKMIQLKEPQEIILKKCMVDELGVSKLYSNTFSPKFVSYIDDNKLIFELEISEKVEKMNCKVNQVGGTYHFYIVGEKKTSVDAFVQDKKVFHRSIDTGVFSIDLNISMSEIQLASVKPKITRKKGDMSNILISFSLQEKEALDEEVNL